MATTSGSEQTPAASLAAAEEKLRSLKMADINELRAFNNPPKACSSVFEGVGVLFEPSKTKFIWDDARKLISQKNNFLEMLRSFGKEHISDDQLNRLSSILAREECQPDRVKSVSFACHGICLWLHAAAEYATAQRQLSANATA